MVRIGIGDLERDLFDLGRIFGGEDLRSGAREGDRLGDRTGERCTGTGLAKYRCTARRFRFGALNVFLVLVFRTLRVRVFRRLETILFKCMFPSSSS